MNLCRREESAVFQADFFFIVVVERYVANRDLVTQKVSYKVMNSFGTIFMRAYSVDIFFVIPDFLRSITQVCKYFDNLDTHH